MPRVELARRAVENLERLILTHSLPANTRERARRTIAPLARFPRLGATLRDEHRDERFLVGPWHWLIVVYEYREAEDRVVVLAIKDGRSAASPG